MKLLLPSNLFILPILCLSLVLQLGANEKIKSLEKARNVSELTQMLRDRDGNIRSSAAVSLSNAIRYVKDPKVLTPLARAHLDAALRDPYKTVREHAGRAFQHSIRNTKDVATLRWVIVPLTDALHGREADEPRRRWASVMLTDVVPRIEHTGVLEQAIPNLLDATLNDPEEYVREYTGRSLKSAVLRIKNPEILHTTAVALVNALDDESQKNRHFSAVLLSSLVMKLEDMKTLGRIAEPLRNAAQSSPDATVREYAGRASKHVDRKRNVTAKK